MSWNWPRPVFRQTHIIVIIIIIIISLSLLLLSSLLLLLVLQYTHIHAHRHTHTHIYIYRYISLLYWGTWGYQQLLLSSKLSCHTQPTWGNVIIVSQSPTCQAGTGLRWFNPLGSLRLLYLSGRLMPFVSFLIPRYFPAWSWSRPRTHFHHLDPTLLRWRPLSQSPPRTCFGIIQRKVERLVLMQHGWLVFPNVAGCSGWGPIFWVFWDPPRSIVKYVTCWDPLGLAIWRPAPSTAPLVLLLATLGHILCLDASMSLQLLCLYFLGVLFLFHGLYHLAELLLSVSISLYLSLESRLLSVSLPFLWIWCVMDICTSLLFCWKTCLLLLQLHVATTTPPPRLRLQRLQQHTRTATATPVPPTADNSRTATATPVPPAADNSWSDFNHDGGDVDSTKHLKLTLFISICIFVMMMLMTLMGTTMKTIKLSKNEIWNHWWWMNDQSMKRNHYTQSWGLTIIAKCGKRHWNPALTPGSCISITKLNVDTSVSHNDRYCSNDK